MKKIFAIIIAAALVFCFCGCGIPFTAEKIIDDSDIYSKRDIEKAMNKVYSQFALFEGCALLELEYDEEYSKERMCDWAENYGAEEAIVLLSKFFVSKETEGALEKGEIAKWSWIFIRNKGGSWEFRDCGYP